MTTVLVAISQKRKPEFEAGYWKLLIDFNLNAIDAWKRRTEKDFVQEYREQREADFAAKLEDWKKAQAEKKKQMENERKEQDMVGGNINDSGAGQAQQAFKEDPAPKYQDLTDEEVKKLVKAKVD